jgi:hypothetical protein
MALQMNYEDYPESYWRLSSYTLSPINKHGSLRFSGYASKEERDASKLPVAGEKKYHITPELYDAYFAPDELNPEGVNPIKAAYLYAAQDEFFKGAEET